MVDAQSRADRSAGVVLFTLGVAAAGSAPDLRGPALIALLGELGLSESAGRAAILRMRRHGLLSSRRDGRHTRYAAAPAILAHQRRIREHFGEDGPEWDGRFHALLYDVPERQRAFRDRLRYTARLLGYGQLRAGLLIAPGDRYLELRRLIPAVPSGARLLPAHLELSAPDARRVARELWNLDALAQEYRAIARDTRRLVARAQQSQSSGAAALRVFAEATQPIYAAIGRDPLLPAELLGDDWPADELLSALNAALVTLGASALAHVEDVRRA